MAADECVAGLVGERDREVLDVERGNWAVAVNERS